MAHQRPDESSPCTEPLSLTPVPRELQELLTLLTLEWGSSFKSTADASCSVSAGGASQENYDWRSCVHEAALADAAAIVCVCVQPNHCRSAALQLLHLMMSLWSNPHPTDQQPANIPTHSEIP